MAYSRTTWFGDAQVRQGVVEDPARGTGARDPVQNQITQSRLLHVPHSPGQYWHFPHDLRQNSHSGELSFEEYSSTQTAKIAAGQNYIKIKRFIDFIAAIIALVVLFPVLAAIALVIACTYGGPLLFWQERVGHRGRVFQMCKFRTMRSIPDFYGADSQESDPCATDEGLVALRSRDRVTAVGRILRRYRLDELPQIWNIIRGEMSWIGPRPETVDLTRQYQKKVSCFDRRLDVLPGISGWAQVNQGHVSCVAGAREKLTYDLYYIKNQSASLDLIIVLKTIRTVLSGFGAR
ncbi:MAG: sugar transferase [Rhizobiaceae bacterium]